MNSAWTLNEQWMNSAWTVFYLLKHVNQKKKKEKKKKRKTPDANVLAFSFGSKYTLYLKIFLIRINKLLSLFPYVSLMVRTSCTGLVWWMGFIRSRRATDFLLMMSKSRLWILSFPTNWRASGVVFGSWKSPIEQKRFCGVLSWMLFQLDSIWLRERSLLKLHVSSADLIKSPPYMLFGHVRNWLGYGICISRHLRA